MHGGFALRIRRGPLRRACLGARIRAESFAAQRGVILRTGFVLGRDRGAGGALARLRTLVKMGLGGRVGSGRQGMSWIHEADLNRLFEWAARR